MAALPIRQIGSLSVSAIGLGCMNLNHAYGTPPSEADGIKLLQGMDEFQDAAAQSAIMEYLEDKAPKAKVSKPVAKATKTPATKVAKAPAKAVKVTEDEDAPF